MPNDTLRVDEVYNADASKKQFNLLSTFDTYAKSRWYTEASITQAKEEISRRFAQFNAEGMDERRFKNLSKTISNMVESELSRAKNKLQEQSGAMIWVPLKSENIPTNTPVPTLSQKPNTVSLDNTLKAVKWRNEILASL